MNRLKPRNNRITALLCLVTSLPALSHAQQLCPDTTGSRTGIQAVQAPEDPESIAIEADRVDVSDESRAIFSGDVIVAQSGQTLRADSITADQENDTIDAEGNVVFADEALELTADSARSELETDRTELNAVDYRLNRTAEGLTARGQAETLVREGNTRTQLTTATFTSCPQTEDGSAPVWQIVADEIELQHETGRGKAHDARLKFGDVTLFRLPYASFPIDDRRKSGFLYPSIGSSNDNGLDVAIPWYWNIAPHMDATLTPRWIGDRGAMLSAEYRYLTDRSSGTISGSYLPDDDLFDRHRGTASLQHLTTFNDTWQLYLDMNHVSDPDYFEDLGDSLYDSSRTFLPSTALLSAAGDWWQMRLQTNTYERLTNTTSEIYERLPRLAFSGSRRIGKSAFHFNLDAEYSSFELDRLDSLSNPARPDGSRLDLTPSISYPVFRPAYYFEPSIGVRHTRYDLDRDSQDSPDRTTPIVSVEAGLFFERQIGETLQTLEPKAYYLYVPFENQDEIPLFDSRELTFGFSQLFRPNRFTGADRQADANQLSLALTSRTLETASGRERLELSLGTIVYFRDQRVQLLADSDRDASTSPIVAEINYSPVDDWYLQLGAQYDPDDEEFNQALGSVTYRKPGSAIFNLSYRKRIDRIRQVDMSFLWPVNERWSVIGRGNYSLMDDTIIEGLLGFEYQSCCWAGRLMARRYIRNNEGDRRNSIYFEIELKGLGSFGRKTGNLLQRSIRGYRSEDYRGY